MASHGSCSLAHPTAFLHARLRAHRWAWQVLPEWGTKPPSYVGASLAWPGYGPTITNFGGSSSDDVTVYNTVRAAVLSCPALLSCSACALLALKRSLRSVLYVQMTLTWLGVHTVTVDSVLGHDVNCLHDPAVPCKTVDHAMR